MLSQSRAGLSNKALSIEESRWMHIYVPKGLRSANIHLTSEPSNEACTYMSRRRLALQQILSARSDIEAAAEEMGK